ncbi:hypothetical protein [Cupriavidus sp. a3]|uniref:hypothetical protein n=1 Tax=Cupriavidus sp. a3 TaxID=3242158 RepID=UPI003D9C55FB
MASDSQSTEYLCDFAYLDRNRAALYFSQLNPESGAPTQVKRTEKHGGTDGDKLTVGIPKLIATEFAGNSQFERSLEGQFDPTWLLPIEAMQKLDELNYISTNLEEARIGGLALLTGRMRIIDIRFLKELWPFVGEMVTKQVAEALPNGGNHKIKQQFLAAKKKENDLMASVIAKMPHALQATFYVDDKQLWTTLPPENMLINPEDLALKHGAEIAGEWHLLGVIDALPEDSLPQPIPGEQLDLEDGMINILNAMRTFMGRKSSAFGVTPIAIFRTIKPGD